MQLYEVQFPLEAGNYLNMLMTAPDVHTAIANATKVLRLASEPRHVGDVIKYNWDADEITATRVVSFQPSDVTFDKDGNMVKR